MVAEETMTKRRFGNPKRLLMNWKTTNLEIIRKRLSGWQLESFNESYEHKISNGMSLFKKNLKNE